MRRKKLVSVFLWFILVPGCGKNASKNSSSEIKIEIDPKVVQAKVDELANTPDADPRKCPRLTFEIAEFGEAAVEPLIAALKNKEKQLARDYIAQALGMIGDKRAVEPLLDVWTDKSYGWGDDSQMMSLMGEKVDPKAIKELKKYYGITHHRAAKVLCWITGQDFGNEKEKWKQWFDANRSAFLSRKENRLEHWTAKSNHKDRMLRQIAVCYLSRMRDDQALKAVVERLGDKDSDVRSYAARKIVEVGEAAIPHLEEALQRPNEKRCEGALEALTEIGGTKATQALARAMGSKFCGQEASWKLRKIGKPAVQSICQVLDRGETRSRKRAIKTLEQIGDREATDDLVRLLKDPDPKIREVAAHALYKIRDPKAVDALIAVKTDSNFRVRLHATWALKAIGNREAIGGLIEYVQDSNRYVLQYAVQSLEELTQKNFGSNYSRWKQWFDKSK